MGERVRVTRVLRHVGPALYFLRLLQIGLSLLWLAHVDVDDSEVAETLCVIGVSLAQGASFDLQGLLEQRLGLYELIGFQIKACEIMEIARVLWARIARALSVDLERRKKE